MSQYSRYGNRHSTNRQSGTPRRQPSVVSNVSGIADSTISVGTLVTGESLQLSQFPQPPRYTPLSPIQSEVGSMSSRRRDDGRSIYSVTPSLASDRERGSPLTQSPVPPVPPLPPQASSSRGNLDANSIMTSRTFSPYDWHEGASSIDMDVTEDRLLPTAFITQLLRENPEPRNRHISSNSDAYSGFSELTYPPPPHRLPGQSPPRSLPPRPTGGRPSPASSHIHRAGSQSDSDTLITSTVDEYTRSTSRSTQGRPAPPSSYLAGKARGWDEHSEDDQSLRDYKPGAPYGMMTIDEDPSPPPLPENRRTQRENRKSISTRSFVSSLISRAPSTSSRSVRSLRRAFDWMRKPLPPVPAIPPKFSQPVPVPRHHEEDLPLPELINRADTLSNLLEKGHHPHRSLTSSFFTRGDTAHQPQGLSSAFDDHSNTATMNFAHRHGSVIKTRADSMGTTPEDQQTPVTCGVSLKSRLMRILACLAFVVLVVIGVALGVSLSRKHNSLPNCQGNFTGATCNLDATCVCTSPSEPCLPLAQHLIDLRPTLNANFGTNYTTRSLALSLFYAQGSPAQGENCAAQAMLVDVSTLPASQSNRTTWAQTALLWNLAESGDVGTSQKLRDSVAKAPWNDLGSDGPVDASSPSFTFTSSGFLFDFAGQTVVPAKELSFHDGGHLSSTQSSRVGSAARTVLGRMYTSSLASSSQKSKALDNYWRSVLQQQPSDLPVFLSALGASPILLPFDAAASGNQDVVPLLHDATSFPPPVACYPNLTTTQIQNINAIETSVFNLPPLTSSTSFQPSCFPDRPVYGVLDILRLRLPFVDSRPGATAKQAVTLKREASSRVIVYTNEALAALPFGDGFVASPNRLNYGTLSDNNFKHVVFNYLSSISDVNDAIAVIRFVLTGVATPPTNTSTQLTLALSRLPSLEVAAFGTISLEDVESVVSSFSTPTGSLFFGSEQGFNMRQAIINAGSRVVWAENATSPLVVRDSTFTDAEFNQTWAAAASRSTASVNDVVNALSGTRKFTP